MTAPLLRTNRLIDDSEADNLFHGLLLERSGLALCVKIFEWAEKALESFADSAGHDVDLVLLDINMPRMDGFEFLDRFHLLPDEHRGDARIFMLSSSPLDHEPERALGYPRVADFIVKPPEDETLLQLARVRTIR
jgi:CheY-like chemotaxis protein